MRPESKLSFALTPALVAALLVAGLTNPVTADTFTVTNASDAPVPDYGSLRWAVGQANANGTAEDTIDFSLPPGTTTIVLLQGKLEVQSSLRIVGPVPGDPVALTIDGNNADQIIYASGNLTLENLTLTNGNAPFSGGAVKAGALTGDFIRVTGNAAAGQGGGLNVYTLVLSNSEVTNNESTGCCEFTHGAGGIYSDSTAVITDSVISDNSTNYFWGGMRTGNLTLTRSTVSGNSAADLGGGLVVGGNLTITDSAITGNSAGERAGGIFHLSGPNSVNIKNSTISGNSATGANGHGGAFFGSAGTFTIINSTITGNSAAGQGDGICFDGGNFAGLDLQNTILSGNVGGEDLALYFGTGTITADHSLVGTGVPVHVNDGGVVFSNTPGLDPLADNGGPTHTHALQPTSLALDAGDNDLVPAGTLTDQRGAGFARTADADGIGGAIVDMGAFELNPSAVGIVDVSIKIHEDSGPVGVGVIRTGTGAGTALLDYTTANGSAIAGQDYTFSSDTISWAEGELGAKTISVPITPDSDPEPDENFTVSLTDLSGTGVDSLATSSATVIILNDDLSADCAITKSNHQVGVTIGSSITYTIVASNAGPDDVTGATVADTLPAELDTCTWSCAALGSAMCTASPPAGNLSDTADLPAGDSVTYTGECDVSASASGTLENTATLTAPPGVTDPNSANDAATDSDALSTDPPLSIEMFGEETGMKTVEAQETITVTNLTVKAGAVLTLRAGSEVILGDTVVVEDGAELVIEIDPTLLP